MSRFKDFFFCWGKLHVLAFIAFAMLMTSVAASSANMTREQRLAWDKMCTIHDCNQFPMGYLAYEMGGNKFYFPLDAEKPSRTHRNKDLLFVDTVGPRSVLRMVWFEPDNKPTKEFIHLFPCCLKLMKHFGLSWGDMPGISTTPTSIEIFNSDRVLTAPRIGFSSKKIGVDYEEIKKTNDLQEIPFRSFGSHLWIVPLQSKTEKNKVFRFLSKRPLLFGRHVWVSCRLVCRVETTWLTEDGKDEGFHAYIQGMRSVRPGVESPKTACVPQETWPCIYPEGFFETLPQALADIETLFTQLMTHPEQRER